MDHQGTRKHGQEQLQASIFIKESIPFSVCPETQIRGAFCLVHDFFQLLSGN
jgi:hypothetical protein